MFDEENPGGQYGNKPAGSFQDLKVWQKAHQLVLAVYRLSKNFPKDEMYGLTSQLRRATVSIVANIAEGFKKYGKADKVRFMNISQGSLEEVRYYFILTNDLGYGNTQQEMSLLEEVSRMLQAYIKRIKESQ
ncbi:MAG TPA: four helix bundle protein [Cytophagales bacterium]|nr:four helix bundle protein [Cytophagales bacterium]HAA23147.1 four helix bundle protein [Cytophagales bacterium]HAP58879.1 four helix bundle protein [Cytophagales bacterium]